ncbi:hypothetical protein F5Y09DRAFT_100992 [Xylaria sp. FL1042]|nr:hypothetical protein F5Y09DRAFT_100992 [Xylaria sp. FL1042]
MAACPERDFKDAKTMLRHLKHCELFSQGKFWCPLCQRNDSFKVVSKTKCSWDKVNIARRLWQKLRRFQNTSSKHGRPHCCCYCHKSRNDTPPSAQSEFPIPSVGFGVPIYDVVKPAAISELPNTGITFELDEMNRKSHYMKNLEVPRQPSWSGAPMLMIPSHQVSPSEPSSASLGRSDYSSDISPASANHTNESPVLGRPQVAHGNVAINIEPLSLVRQASQASRRGEVPLLTVDTRQSIPSPEPPECIFNMLLDEGQTLGCSTGIDDLGMGELASIIAPQPNEILTINTAYVINEALAPYENVDLHPSPSVSAPSYSNCELSPSSMSSGPVSLQCQHNGCDFKPSGRRENLRAYMRKHMKKHQKNAIPCEHCDKKFTRQDNLTSHIRKVHLSVNESQIKRRRGSFDSIRSAGQPRRKESRREPYGTC